MLEIQCHRATEVSVKTIKYVWGQSIGSSWKIVSWVNCDHCYETIAKVIRNSLFV